MSKQSNDKIKDTIILLSLQYLHAQKEVKEQLREQINIYAKRFHVKPRKRNSNVKFAVKLIEFVEAKKSITERLEGLISALK